MSLFPKFKIPCHTPASLATSATVPNESSGNSESSNAIKELGKEAALPSQCDTPCWNCSQTMSEAKTIFGDDVMVCWACAKWA